MYNNVKVEIFEQPQQKSLRFRYSSEGKSAGSILGVKSTEDVKTYPSIRVLNYEGNARVCVSCVTVDEIPKPHPNCLVGKPCSNGICVFDFTTKAASPRLLRFPQLGIQCPKLNEVEKNLEKRQEKNIDPFNTGFGHKDNEKSINLHQIRLCFQVFLMPDPTNLIPLEPVVSDIICDKHKTNVKLRIVEKSANYSAACGDKKIIILCDKVDKRDIRVRFYEIGTDNSVIWQDLAKFRPKDVHKQVGISFRTPKYRDQTITKPVNVFFRLETISDGTCSDPIPFQYVPDNTNVELALNNKVAKIDDSKALYEFLQVLTTSNMAYDFDANATGAENVIPAGSYFGASNCHAPDNNAKQSQQYKPQKSDYQSSSAQANYEQSHCFNQQQHYPATAQFNTESKYGNFSASTFGNAPFATSTNSNNFSSSVQPGSYRSSQADNCPVPMNCDKGTYHSCQQMGPVYTADKMIIQQFHNSNVTIHQPKNIVDVPMSDGFSSEMNVF